jgi:hypothetical protein
MICEVRELEHDGERGDGSRAKYVCPIKYCGGKMHAADFVPVVFFFLTTLVVAVRLLALWRRTRELPELVIGMGVVLVSVIGMPLALAGRLPQNVATAFGNAVFGVGFVFVCSGITLFFVFTASVFHAGSRWARAAVAAAGIAMAAIALGLIRAASFGNDITEIIANTRSWAIAAVGMLVAAFAWTAYESLRYYRQLLRRRTLGFADPVVENRFLMWGVGGVAMVVMAGSIAGSLVAGKAVLLDPLALGIMAASGLVMGSTWLLTFFPPRFYLRLIGGESAAVPGTDGT